MVNMRNLINLVENVNNTNIEQKMQEMKKFGVEFINTNGKETGYWGFRGAKLVILVDDDFIKTALNNTPETRWDFFLFDSNYGLIPHEHDEALLTVHLLSGQFTKVDPRFKDELDDAMPALHKLLQKIGKRSPTEIRKFFEVGNRVPQDIMNIAGWAHDIIEGSIPNYASIIDEFS